MISKLDSKLVLKLSKLIFQAPMAINSKLNDFKLKFDHPSHMILEFRRLIYHSISKFKELTLLTLKESRLKLHTKRN